MGRYGIRRVIRGNTGIFGFRIGRWVKSLQNDIREAKAWRTQPFMQQAKETGLLKEKGRTAGGQSEKTIFQKRIFNAFPHLSFFPQWIYYSSLIRV